jgi:UDP-2,3-diacylglucosamine pyrophosphatase LpxH
MIEQKPNESWNDYVLRCIDNRIEEELSHEQLYRKLYNLQYSNESCRKKFSAIKQHILANKELREELPDNETFEIQADGTQRLEKFISACEEDLKDPERILELLGYDPLKWQLINAKHNRWNVYSKKDGKELLYSIKATVKPREIKLDLDNIKKAITSLKIKQPTNSFKNKYNKFNDLMLEIPLFDVHLNKRSLYDDESIEDQCNHYYTVIQQFLSRVESKDIGKIIFPIGQDFFNIDNFNNTTTKGTTQQTTVTCDKMFKYGVQLLINCIEIMRMKAPVEVLLVSGNHDTSISFYAAVLLEKYYERCDDVNVNSDLKRKYVEWGKCLIGFSHGDKEKNRLQKENVMQVEMKEAWGRSLFREWHCGHVHHEKLKEIGGIKYRTLNSISSTDQWHYECGYVGALRMAQAFLWHKDYGLLEIHNTPVGI